MSLEVNAGILMKPKKNMIYNFTYIKRLLQIEPDYFYFIQIIQRKKENPELGSNNRIIRSYNIDSITKYEKNIPEIIKLCDMFNARAYIHLNRRRWSKIALEVLRYNAELIANGQYEGIKSSLETVIGRNNCETKENKTWILDCDGMDTPSPLMMATIEYECQPLTLDLTKPKCLHTIETKNGCHLITRPFDTQVFHSKYPDIEIHKDNPTILYIP